MRKKLSVVLVVTGMALISVLPGYAAEKDSDAKTYAYINYSQTSNSHIVGKSYATSTNSNFKSLNVQGSLYQGTSLKESGTASTSTKGNEAAWYTKDKTYSSSNSYTLQTASRTYYKDGTSSDQSYASDTW